jgi:iron complex outermembrane receptor protein
MKPSLASVSTVAIALVISQPAYGQAAEAQAQPAHRQSDSQGGGDALQDDSPASAEGAQDDIGLEDIVVTAERRSSDVQRSAISITVATGDALVESGVTDVRHLAQAVPQITVVEAQGAYPQFGIRGIFARASNSNTDPAIIMSVDGVVLNHPSATHGMFYDLERVEVLKGPQGTLYGRNATGGVINAISAKPTFDLGGFAMLEVGNYDLLQASGALNVPLSDTLAVRASFQRVTRDGYYSDGASDDQITAGRVSVRWEPTADLSILARADYAHVGGRGAGVTIIDLNNNKVFPYGPWSSSSDNPCAYLCAPPLGGGSPYAAPRDTFMDNNYAGATVEVNWRTPLGTLTVLPGYRQGDVSFLSAVNMFFARQTETHRQWSIEARLASDGARRLSYVIGAYYMDDKVRARQNYEQLVVTNPNQTPNPALSRVTDQHYNTAARSGAIFGQLTWSVSDTLRLVGGARYTVETKAPDGIVYNYPHYDPDIYRTAPYKNCNKVVPAATPTTAICVPGPPANVIPFPGQEPSTNWNALNWKVGLEWDVRPRSLVYANVSTGFRAGGYFFGTEFTGNTYDPEHVTAYVIGAKNRFLNNRLQINAELFYYEYSNQQISHLVQTPGAPVYIVENVGDSTSKGAELEVQYLATENTMLNFMVQRLDTIYGNLTYEVPSAPSTGCPFRRDAVRSVFIISCNDQRAMFAPKWVLSGGIQQTVPLSNGGNLVGSLGGRYRSGQYTDFSFLPVTRTGSHTVADASLTYRSPGSWKVTAFMNNVFNDVTASVVYLGSLGRYGPIGATVTPPRTYGLRLNTTF